MEHGAVVLLYHPCADMDKVDKLRGILRGCIRQYILILIHKSEKQCKSHFFISVF